MVFKCKDQCGVCCGIVPIPKDLAMELQSFSKVKPTEVIEIKGSLFIFTKDMLCVFLDRKTKECSIYSKRPDICKRYGIDPKLPCPYFDADGNRRNRLERIRKEIEINNLVEALKRKLFKR